MMKRIEFRDILLILVLIMLVVNTAQNLAPRRVEAETFRIDSCVTSKPDDKPMAYLHVVSH